MNNQLSALTVLKRMFFGLIALAIAGILSAILLARPALADTPIFVRPGGDDGACNGTANVDYDPGVAPACALKTPQRALSLAGAANTVILDNGSETIIIPPTVPSGDIAAANVDLVVEKSDFPETVQVGSTLTYTIRITNEGSSLSTGVVLVDTLPQTGVVSVHSITPGTCNLWEPFNIVRCPLIDLNAGATTAVTIVVTPTAAGNIFNSATVNDDDGNGDSDTELTQVEGVTNLSVSKTHSPASVIQGHPLTYTLTVTNGGPSAAADVVLTDQLPTGATFNSAESSPACDDSSGPVICDVGLLNDGGVATYTLVVTPTTFGLITNVVTVTGGDNDPNPDNNVFTETTTVIPVADLEVSKSDDPDPVAPGGTLTYTLTVDNNGPGPASDVTLDDTLPAEFNFNNASGNQLLLHLDELTPAAGFADASGNNYHGSCNDLGGTCPTAGMGSQTGFGTALQFDGVNDFVDLADPSGLDFGGQITLMAWISPSNISPASGLQDIVTHGYSTSPPAAVFLRLNNDYYQVGSWDSGGNHLTSLSAAGDQGNWVHLAGVYDGSYWRLYRNGTLAASTPNGTGAIPVDGNWFVGGRDDSLDRRAFQGLIDEVAIFDRALSAAEIAEIYDEALTGGIDLDPDQGSCGAVNGGVSCNLGNLNASDGVTVTLIGTVASTATGTILNTVSVTSTTVSDPNLDNNADTVTTDIQDGSGGGPSTTYLPIILRGFANPTLTLYWNDWETVRNKVSPLNGGPGLVPDTREDGVFRAILNMGSQTKRVDSVVMTTSQAPGIIWDTIDNTHWVLGIFDGGSPLNDLGDGTIDHLVSGVLAVTLYASDVDSLSPLYSLFPPDEYTYTVTVYFDDGSSLSASARIPPVGEPPEPPPPPLPPPPPGPSACQPIAKIPVGDEPRGVVVDETRDRVYVANYNSDSVSVIDSSSNAILRTIGGVTTANGLALDRDRNVLWVTNYSTDRATPIQNPDSAGYSVGTPLIVGDGPWGVAYVNDYVYVTNRNSSTVTVIDAADTADRITLSSGFNQPYHLAANPNSNKVYVANFGNHTVTIINGTSVSEVIDLNTGDPSTQPYGIAVDEIRNVVYVAAVNSHRVVAIDGSADAILGWATFHRGFGDPGRPVPLRVIAVNPDIGPFGDGGHLWTTTATVDGSEVNQALLVPKGWGGYFHFPVPCDVGINPSEGIAVHRSLDRAYVSSGNDTDNSPGTLNVFDDPDPAPLVPFSATDGIAIEVFRVE